MAPIGSFSITSIAVRILIGVVACVSVVWAVFSVPIFWKQYPVEIAAKRIVTEEIFKPDYLASIKSAGLEAEGAKEARTSVLSGAAIVNLRLLELALTSNGQKRIDLLIQETQNIIRKSLAAAPANPFLWTVLFWLENTRTGFALSHLDYLRMSYSLGPNEGWVAIRRNRFAIAVFAVLSPDLATNAVAEFSRLVGSTYFDAAAAILEGPGWPIRAELILSLEPLEEVKRQAFAKLIYRHGINLAVPGIQQPEWRPWH